MLRYAALALSLAITSLAATIDFRNFTYPFDHEVDEIGMPGGISWLPIKAQARITLVNGRWDSHDNGGPAVTLEEVHYGYVTMSPVMDAIVVLTYHTGGTAFWSYVYVYQLGGDRSKLVALLRTGTRSAEGLYRVYASNGELTLDLFDPERRTFDCCSTGFIRGTWIWKAGRFVEEDAPQYGNVEMTSPRRPAEDDTKTR